MNREFDHSGNMDVNRGTRVYMTDASDFGDAFEQSASPFTITRRQPIYQPEPSPFYVMEPAWQPEFEPNFTNQPYQEPLPDQMQSYTIETPLPGYPEGGYDSSTAPGQIGEQAFQAFLSDYSSPPQPGPPAYRTYTIELPKEDEDTPVMPLMTEDVDETASRGPIGMQDFVAYAPESTGASAVYDNDRSLPFHPFDMDEHPLIASRTPTSENTASSMRTPGIHGNKAADVRRMNRQNNMDALRLHDQSPGAAQGTIRDNRQQTGVQQSSQLPDSYQLAVPLSALPAIRILRDGGGHFTQTMEIPLLGSELIQRADTQYGVFVEIDNRLPGDLLPSATEQVFGMTEMDGVQADTAQQVSADPGGHFSQTMEIPLLGSELIRRADTNYGVFVEIGTPQPEKELSPEQEEDGPVVQDGPRIEGHREIDSPTMRRVKGTGKRRQSPPFMKVSYDELQDEDLVDDEEYWYQETNRLLKAGYEDMAQPAGHTFRQLLKRIFSARLITFLLLSVILFTPVALFSYVFHVVHLEMDGEDAITFISRQTEVAAILLDAGYEMRPADRYELYETAGTFYLHLERSARVVVVSDGREYEHYVMDKTVGQAIDELGIVLGEDDELSMPIDTVLSEGDFIEVFRVRYETEQRLETVEWKEIDKPSVLLREGDRRVMNPGRGQDGEAMRTYTIKYVNDEKTGEVITEEIFTKYPTNVVTLVGSKEHPLSHFEGNEFSDIQIVDNKPEQYEWMMVRGRCTAYSFSPGTFGASGMYLFQGFVAVNDNVIPLGSLMYITSADGSFIYGWAVAADVGTAMYEGYVDVDCFFETYQESVLFGVHYLNVYIVKQLTQGELQKYAANEGMFRRRVPS